MKKDKVIVVRVSEIEKQKIQEILKGSPYNYLSQLIIASIFNYKISIDKKVFSNKKNLDEEKVIPDKLLIKEVNYIGKNFNQLMALLNSNKVKYINQNEIGRIKKNIIEIYKIIDKIIKQ